MITNKIYPEIEVKTSKHRITLESWILVKRKGTYYRVKSFDSGPLPDLCSDLRDAAIIRHIEDFHSRCTRIRYLWVLPDKLAVRDLITRGSLEKDINILNFKERFLLNIRIL